MPALSGMQTDIRVFGDNVQAPTLCLGSRTVAVTCRGSGEFRGTPALFSDTLTRHVTYYPMGNLTSEHTRTLQSLLEDGRKAIGTNLRASKHRRHELGT
jgi:hypothetical protein